MTDAEKEEKINLISDIIAGVNMADAIEILDLSKEAFFKGSYVNPRRCYIHYEAWTGKRYVETFPMRS